MNPWNSFLQTVFQFVKSLFGGVTKKMHRNAAVLTMGATLIAVIPFTAVDFQGGGKNAIVAFAETQGGSDEDSLEETEDTALPETDGNVLEDETTADEASSAETEADIRTETENTETKEESITEPAAGSENADTDHGPEEAVETETAAAAATRKFWPIPTSSCWTSSTSHSTATTASRDSLHRSFYNFFPPCKTPAHPFGSAMWWSPDSRIPTPIWKGCVRICIRSATFSGWNCCPITRWV